MCGNRQPVSLSGGDGDYTLCVDNIFTACEITQHNFQRSPKPDIAMLIVLMGTEVIGVCDGENGLGEKTMVVIARRALVR